MIFTVFIIQVVTSAKSFAVFVAGPPESCTPKPNKIAKIIGTKHSNEFNKFENLKYTQKGSMILIDEAKVLMECVVDEIQNLDGDLLVFLKVEDFNESENKQYLDGYDPKCY